MLKVCMYTCVTAGYDDLILPVKQNYPVDFIHFSDTNVTIYDLSSNTDYEPIVTCQAYDPWIHHIELKDKWLTNKDKMTSILIRCDLKNNPYFKNYDLVIYMDGNVIIDDPNFINHYFISIIQKSPDYDIIVSKHNIYNSIYEEIKGAQSFMKYNNTDFNRMAALYNEPGLNPNIDYWTGIIGYNQCKKLDDFYDLYTKCMFEFIIDTHKTFHPEGQVFLPYCLQKTNMKVYMLEVLYGRILSINDHKNSDCRRN